MRQETEERYNNNNNNNRNRLCVLIWVHHCRQEGDGDIGEVAVLSVGSLLCGLDPSHVGRMTAPGVTDALPTLSDCPNVSPDTLRTARQTMMRTMSL